MAMVASWMYCVCSCGVVLWYSINAELVHIGPSIDFYPSWFLVLTYVTVCNVSPALP